MRANADQHDPVLMPLLGAVEVGGGRPLGQIVVAGAGVDQVRDLDLHRRRDLLLGAVAYEHRLAAPQHGNGLAFLDGAKVYLQRGSGLRGGVRVHLLDERPQCQCGANPGKGLRGDHDEVAPVGVFCGVRRQGCLP